MHLLFVLNHVRDLEAKQTSALLIQSCLKAGHCTTITGIQDLKITTSAICGHGISYRKSFSSVNDLCESVKVQKIEPWASPELILLRTNPSRDEDNLLQHLKQLERLAGSRNQFLNHPRPLLASAGKANLLWLDPDFIPKTWITPAYQDVALPFSYLEHGAVVKPLHGTRGQGIVHILPGDSRRLKKAMLDTKDPVVQEYLPEVVDGDLRVVVFQGCILEVEGQAAVIRRLAPAGDFRTNLHLGGTAQKTDLTARQYKIASQSAQILMQRNIAFAGLDFVGDKIIEINVFATGGLKPAQDLYKKDFCAAIARRL